MAKKYKQTDRTPLSVSEPAVAYRRTPTIDRVSVSKDWNPNVPFVGTQEEWWEHFHQIEKGKFYPADETFQRIGKWLDNYGK